MFNFTPLLGAQSTSPASQSLLELDGGIKILIDVGWDEGFDAEKLKELERQIPTLSVVLLTHATTAHLGAFAHCCKHFPLFTRIPIYATTPVISLGRTLLQDLYTSTPLASSIIPEAALSDSAYSFPALQGGNHPNILLQPPTTEEIANYFSLIHPLKYSQPHQPLPSPFSPPLNGLTITAYSAGHTLGGTIWHVQHGLESIVYAVDWNQAREHVLSGAAWLGGSGAGGAEVIEQLRRPTAMVCSSRGAEREALAGGRQKRDELLLDMIRDTVSRGGSVLIPSDSSARILELAYLLENSWSADPQSFANAPLYLASRTCGATMRYARSMLEWMDDGIVREFEAASSGHGADDNKRSGNQRGSGRSKDAKDDAKKPSAPFDFRHLRLVERRTQVNRMLSVGGPRVILASDTSLEWGFSREALRNLATDGRNLVVLTERVSQPSDAKKGLGRLLWELWSERSGATTEAAENASMQDVGGTEATVDVAQAAPLEGNEVPLYQQYLAQQRQLHNTLQTDGATSLETSADVIDDRSSTTSESSEESDTEHQGKSLNISAAMTHARNKLGLSDAELGINILLRRKNVHDYDIRGKKGREKMFPYVAKRRRGDDFGDLIRPEEYLRAEERDEVDGQDMRDGSAQKDSGVGQKRKWDDQAGKSGSNKRQMANGTTKRRRQQDDSVQGSVTNDEQGENDDSGESDNEASEEVPAGPSKVIFSKETIRLECRIAFVDFSGLHDKRSLQLLIPMIRPRKLILIAGEQEETLALAADCRKLIEAAAADTTESAVDVFTPTIGLTVDASVDTNAWTVKLSQGIVRRLRWQNVKGLGVVAITGRLEIQLPEEDDAATDGGVKKKVKGAKGDGQEASEQDSSNEGTKEVNITPILDVVPASMAAATRSVAQPLHVGDLRLADLRKIMQSSGFAAEFRGEGTLLINGSVVVRKSGTGRIEVESSGFGVIGPGRPDGTFYAVKRKIYEGLAVVAGG
ncbi:putative cleavage and polyadenylation specificity factor subunit 2 protein [Neofusicoccum parvum UCRNP2]|uniref:Cleavage and polyadenylation specificity factor subunit 2 n=1 Tax=Botryosphaeria parva (strain UCR-NP2) TaxID=1287680 RepID=R1GG54_BOTPV|nr:putative cleavage and polyadenylation specificity factor subunit 2 protein [Neofusicoccum parvum UCRNP2]